EGHLGGRNGVEPGQDLAEVAGEPRHDLGEAGLAQDPLRPRLALDVAHHESPAEAVAGVEEEQRFRHRDAMAAGDLQEPELHRRVDERTVRRGVGLGPQHQAPAGRPVDEVEEHRLVRAADRGPVEVLHPRRAAEPPPHRRFEPAGRIAHGAPAAAAERAGHASRRANFWTFPDGVRGKASRCTHTAGVLWGARCSRTWARSSASRMKAATISPDVSSGSPTTATSATPGWRKTTSSISTG